MMKRAIMWVAATACLMAAGVSADTRNTVAAGNWTTVSTWDTGVPGVSDRAEVYHDVTITNDVGTIDIIDGSNAGSVTMDGGSLVVVNGDWNGVDSFSLSNGSTLNFNRYTRAYGTWTVDNSSLLFGTVPQSWTQIELRGNFDCTVRNGSTFWTDSLNCQGDGNQQTITADGAGNTLYVGYIRYGAGNGDTNFKFKMDNTDTALSTWTFDNLDLDFGTRSWNLIVDATEYNGVNNSFTLFSGVDNSSTLSGSFNSVSIIGTNAYVTYEYSDASSTAKIILNIGEPSVPTVTAEAVDPDAAEEGSDPGIIRISRDDTSGDLDVYFTLGGTADTNDYSEIHTSPITIPDGTNSIDLVFTPVDDSDVEGDSGETIELTLAADAAYVVGIPSATITIEENDLTVIATIADGNWTNSATWANGTVPGAANTADINHNIIIDSDVGSVNLFNPDNNNTDFITMSNGTLVVTGGTAMNFRGTTFGLYDGSSFTSAQWYRLVGDVAIIVDGSSFIADDLQDNGGSDTITVRNGSTFTVSSRYPLNNGTTTFSIEGAGNTVYASLDEFGASGIQNFVFKLDNTDAALSTFTFDTLNLTADGTRNLIIDATDWNKKTKTFTLFSGTTLTDGGTFDSVQLIGISGGAERIIYDYENDRIMLDVTPMGTVILIQ